MMALVTDPTAKALDRSIQVAQRPLRQNTDAGAPKRLTISFPPGSTSKSARRTRSGAATRVTGSRPSAAGLAFISSNLPGFGAKSSGSPQQATIQEVHLFSPSIVNEFRFGFGRSTAAFPIDTPYPLGPRVQFEQQRSQPLRRLGGTFPQGREQNTYQFTDNLSLCAARTQFQRRFRVLLPPG